ncbi:MAG: mechanosensitive ion channel family protein [Armatimonadota bacterium]
MDVVRGWFSNPNVVQIATVAAGLVAIYLAVRVLRLVLNRYVDDPGTRYHARKLITLGAYFLAIVLVLIVFRRRLSGLAVFLGVAGAGVAVALREVILSIAGWLAITVGGLYRAGDRIEIAGQRGDVIDISILRTTLMEIGEWVNADLYNGRIVRITNSFVFQQPVFNYSGAFPFVWDEFTLPIRYGSDRKLAREIMMKVATEVVAEYTAGAAENWMDMLRRYRVENARVEPMVTLAANDNWIEYTVRYVVDYKKRRTTKDLIFSRILDEIDRTEGRVKLSSSTQEIVGFPKLSVKMDQDGLEQE